MRWNSSGWLVALLLSGCASQAASRDPFEVPRAQLLGEIQVVAIAPFQLPPDLEQPEAAQAKLAPLIEQELRSAPFRVIPVSETQPIFDRVSRELGPWIDPKTGAADLAQRERIWVRFDQEVRRTLGVEFVLYPDVHVVFAKLDRDVARWDGATATLSSGFRRTFILSHSGEIGAVSLAIRLRRTDGTQPYSSTGGIELIAFYEGAKLRMRPHSELFKDEVRNRAAVHMAAGPLASRESGKHDPAGDPMK